MATTTVRLDKDDEALLDLIATDWGGRSAAIRQAVRLLAAQRLRSDALRAFLAGWDAEAGAVDDDEAAAMAVKYGL